MNSPKLFEIERENLVTVLNQRLRATETTVNCSQVKRTLPVMALDATVCDNRQSESRSETFLNIDPVIFYCS